LGFGNPGRGDDGLGPAFAEAVEGLGLAGVSVDADYQLNVEDAEAVARHRVVVFADADLSGGEPFSFRPLAPEPGLSFTSHSLGPQAVLALAEEVFGARPQSYLLGIRGYDFQPFNESLTAQAEANLKAAVSFFENLMHNHSLGRDRRDEVQPAAGASEEEP
jgi:hydrogenase maturation protease